MCRKKIFSVAELNQMQRKCLSSCYFHQRCLRAVQVLQGAVSPEIKLGLDTAVSALASVTDVELSNDLQVAKVYISIYSDAQGKDIAMKGLSRLEG